MWWIWLLFGLGLPAFALGTLWIVGERGHLVLPSTRAGVGGTRRGRVTLKAAHGYIYSRFANQYIGYLIGRFPYMSAKTKQYWADHYHGKVLTTDLATAVITVDQPIQRCDLEQIIPYPLAREIALTASPDIALFDCPCRAAREHPCEPIQVCMIVGPGAHFVLEHHPGNTRLVTQAEAVQLLQEEHERGHVHVAYFKDACDDKFYAICNCCACCCGGLEAMNQWDLKMVSSSGYVAQIDAEHCIGCGTCMEVCQFSAIAVNDHNIAEVNWEKCMGCGVCEGHCSEGAATLVLEPEKGIPLDVRQIAQAQADGVAFTPLVQ